MNPRSFSPGDMAYQIRVPLETCESSNILKYCHDNINGPWVYFGKVDFLHHVLYFGDLTDVEKFQAIFSGEVM